MIALALEGDFTVKVTPHYIFTIKGQEFKAHEGLMTIVQKLINLGCKDKRLLSLSKYSDVDIFYRNRPVPSNFNLTLIDTRPENNGDWYFTPWSILPGVLPRNDSGDTKLARKNSVISVGNYRITPFGTQWELYSLITGNKAIHSDISVCVWMLYNWGCIENSCSDPDKLIEFCGKWLSFINSKVGPFGFELRVNEGTSVKLADFWVGVYDGKSSGVERRAPQESPKRDSIKEKSESLPKKRGRPRKS